MDRGDVDLQDGYTPPILLPGQPVRRASRELVDLLDSREARLRAAALRRGSAALLGILPEAYLQIPKSTQLNSHVHTLSWKGWTSIHMHSRVMW